jgi:hypothetical protein
MLCHHDKCIFVHIPKTAGQSIEHVFLDRVGLTWETRAPLLLRPNDQPRLGPPRLAHLKAREYVACKYVTPEQFAGYFKFAFARNPWDRVASMYRDLRYEGRCEFKRFVLRELPDVLSERLPYWVGPQAEFVTDASGSVIVDFIGRFEALQADFDRVCARLGIPPRRLPHVNRSPRGRSGGRPYVAYYDEESIAGVARLYRQDLDLFGYRFGAEASGPAVSATSTRITEGIEKC